MVPVEFAGEPVVAGEVSEPAFVLVAFVDHAQNPVRAQRSSIAAGEPAAGVLDPKLGVRAGIGADSVLNLIGDAVAVVALVRLHDRVEPRLRVIGLEELRVAASAGNRFEIANEQHVLDVGAPLQRVGVDVPVVGGFADGSENLRGVECAGRRRRRRT